MKKSGFLLIEVVVAILILSFTILYTFELFTTGFVAYQKSRVKTKVTKFAQTQLEFLASMGGPTPDPSATPHPTPTPTPLPPEGDLEYEQNLHFYYEYTSPAHTDPNLSVIRMIVTGPYVGATGGKGQAAKNFQTLTLVTYLPSYPSSLEEFVDGGTCLSPGGP